MDDFLKEFTQPHYTSTYCFHKFFEMYNSSPRLSHFELPKVMVPPSEMRKRGGSFCKEAHVLCSSRRRSLILTSNATWGSWHVYCQGQGSKTRKSKITLGIRTRWQKCIKEKYSFSTIVLDMCLDVNITSATDCNSAKICFYDCSTNIEDNFGFWLRDIGFDGPSLATALPFILL